MNTYTQPSNKEEFLSVDSSPTTDGKQNAPFGTCVRRPTDKDVNIDLSLGLQAIIGDIEDIIRYLALLFVRTDLTLYPTGLVSDTVDYEKEVTIFIHDRDGSKKGYPISEVEINKLIFKIGRISPSALFEKFSCQTDEEPIERLGKVLAFSAYFLFRNNRFAFLEELLLAIAVYPSTLKNRGKLMLLASNAYNRIFPRDASRSHLSLLFPGVDNKCFIFTYKEKYLLGDSKAE